MALEELTENLLDSVCSGTSADDEFLLQVQQALKIKAQLPAEQQAELQEKLDALSPEIIEQAKNAQAGEPSQTPITEVLNTLVRTGLIQKQPHRQNNFYHFHELVRERCARWMQQHPEEINGVTELLLLQRYGEYYAAVFETLRENNQAGESIEAGRRALTYLCRAQAFEALSNFASGLLVSTRDPQTLQAVIEELQAVIQQAPEGEALWRLNTHLADALRKSGQSKTALPFYQRP